MSTDTQPKRIFDEMKIFLQKFKTLISKLPMQKLYHGFEGNQNSVDFELVLLSIMF